MSNQYDAIVIGSGIGGLVTATQLAAKGANSFRELSDSGGQRRLF